MKTTTRNPKPNMVYQTALAERDRANVAGVAAYFGQLRPRAKNGTYITKEGLFLPRRDRRRALRESRL